MLRHLSAAYSDGSTVPAAARAAPPALGTSAATTTAVIAAAASATQCRRLGNKLIEHSLLTCHQLRSASSPLQHKSREHAALRTADPASADRLPGSNLRPASDNCQPHRPSKLT